MHNEPLVSTLKLRYTETPRFKIKIDFGLESWVCKSFIKFIFFTKRPYVCTAVFIWQAFFRYSDFAF